MGYGYYLLPDGREAGYTVEAICDADGCKTEIDRGLSYLCGENPDGWRDPDEPGCGRYYCPWHLGVHDCPNQGCGIYPCSECEDGMVEPCVWTKDHDGKHIDGHGYVFTRTEYCRECAG